MHSKAQSACPYHEIQALRDSDLSVRVSRLPCHLSLIAVHVIGSLLHI